MNAFELAEITAVLSRRGLDSQCRINMNVGAHTVIYNGNDCLAIITNHSNSIYRAHSINHAGTGNSQATALANLLDTRK